MRGRSLGWVDYNSTSGYLYPERFPKAVQDGLLTLAWWDWSHDRLKSVLDDFRRLDAEAFVEKHS